MDGRKIKSTPNTNKVFVCMLLLFFLPNASSVKPLELKPLYIHKTGLEVS
jgi:hypothetical protein